MSSIIELKAVSKNYGQVKAINKVSLSIKSGEIFGFLGPNGAGKSTTINMLTDLIRPTKGKIEIFGLDSVKDSQKIRQKIGFLNADMSLDSGLTGLQQLTYFGNLRGNLSLKKINDLADQLELNLNRKIKTLSRGNRQKVGLVSALMHDPDLLIMDEPTTGLDPLIQDKFNKIVLDIKKRGKTVFLSSHLLSEVQEICDRVAFVRDGQIIKVQQLENFSESSPKNISIKSSDKKLASALRKIKGVIISNNNEAILKISFSGDINQLISVLAKHKIDDVIIQEINLEDTFMHYYKEDEGV